MVPQHSKHVILNNIFSHWVTHERVQNVTYVLSLSLSKFMQQGLTYPIAWWPGASKTTSQANEFEQSLLIYSAYTKNTNMHDFQC